MELTGHHQPGESGLKVWKPTGDASLCPPRILLAGLHLDWVMCEPLGRTLSQKDRPETPRKLIASPRKLIASPKSLLGSPYPPALHPADPSQSSLLLCQHASPRTIHFWALDNCPTLERPGRGPLSWNNYFREMTGKALKKRVERYSSVR